MRPIPFSVRPAVREQIRHLLEDGIIETSTSPYLSPLFIVNQPGKPPRICVDARKINEITVADFEKMETIQELIQRFHGV
jgi:hypothetical protein